MTMTDVYRINPEIITSTKDNLTRAISLHSEESDLFILRGAASQALNFFDGISSLEEVRKKLDESLKIQGSPEDFQKMVTFLIEKKLILKTN